MNNHGFIVGVDIGDDVRPLYGDALVMFSEDAVDEFAKSDMPGEFDGGY